MSGVIFVVAAAVVVLAVRYARVVRQSGWKPAAMELGAAAVGGLTGGVWLGIAARGAMRVLALVAAAPPRFSTGGSLQVIGTFAALGAGLGILYAGLFRHALASSGLWFGLLVIAVTAYPLGVAAVQVLPQRPTTMQLALGAAAVLAAMWLPYALLVERVTARLHRRLRPDLPHLS